MRQCAYELTDSPRPWYDSVFTLIRTLKLKRSTLDHVLFTTHRQGKLALVVVAHVDDFLISVRAEEVAHFDTALRAAFAGGPTTSGDITFTRIRIRTELEADPWRIAIRVAQEAFIESIDAIVVPPEGALSPSARLEPAELTNYRRTTGALLWATGQTLPHMACATTTLARRFTCAVFGDLSKANKVVAAAKAARPMPLQ